MKWRALQAAVLTPEHEASVRRSGLDGGDLTVWVNNQYQVYRLVIRGENNKTAYVHLSIRRLDRRAIHDWRHFQNIKNELTGPEWEAVELYPAESRMIDEANQYHLWCYPFVLQVGYHGPRQVGDAEAAKAVGAKQRPFENSKPKEE